MKKKHLVGASLLLAILAVVIYFSTRSRDPKGEPTKSSTSNEAGWKIGLYRIADGNLKQFGGGVARTKGTSGQLLALDVTFDTSDSQGRIVVNHEGAFIGVNASGRNVWVDFTEPIGSLPLEQAVGFARAVKPGSKPVRSVSSSGRQYDVFDSPGDSFVTKTESVLSRNETWIDAAGQIRRIVCFTDIVSKNVKLHSVVTIADRDDSVAVAPPPVRRGDAIPAAAALRRLVDPGADGTAARRSVDEWFAAEHGEMRLDSGLLPSNHPAQLVLVQGIHPAKPIPGVKPHITPAKPIPDEPLPPNHVPSFEYCEWLLENSTGQFDIDCKDVHLRLPDPPSVPFPNVGDVTPEQSSGHRFPSPSFGQMVCLGEGIGSVARSHIAEEVLGEVLEWALKEGPLAIFLELEAPLLFLNPITLETAGWVYFGVELLELGHCWISAHVAGDPHLNTFDGHSYDFQAIGEFIQSKTPELEVQVRLDGIKGVNTRTVATAVRVGPHVVESYLPPSSQKQDSFSVIIDGSARDLGFNGISFKDGTFVARRHGSRGFWNRDDNVLIVDPVGSYVLIEAYGFSQNVKVSLARDAKIKGGLGGVPDGDTSNDFILRNGTAMSQQAAKTIDGLYGRFAQSWRVRPEERLFTQGAASDFLTDKYTSLPVKITRLSDFSEAEIEKARGECRQRGIQGALLDDCIYDVLVTGDVAWADQAAASAATWSLTGNTPSVIRNAVDIEAPHSVAAGSTIEFAWKGPNTPGDLIFIAPPDMATNQYPASNNHATEKGSPAKLVAPAKEGRYEIRYFSHVKGDVVSRVPLTVTAANVRLDAPQNVAAGSVIQVPWKGPNTPGDLIFIATSDMATNEYPGSNNHATEKGSPARLIAPAKAGRYEIRYFSHVNGDVVSRVPLTVTDPEVRLDAPGTVAAGSTLEFAWKGPNAPNDFIFIATPGMASNEFFSGPATQAGSPAKLVAPAKAGRYEIRYFSHANGTVLKKRLLVVR